MIVLALVILLLLCEAAFCKTAKLLEKSAVKSRAAQQRDSGKESLLLRGYRYANDFTFLFFKLVGFFPSHHVRMLLYRYVFQMDIGKKAVIYYGLEARKPWNITIGEDSVIGDHAIIHAIEPVSIGRHVNISTGCWLWTGQHDVNSRSFSTEGKLQGITVGDFAWLSNRTSLLPGCDIAEGVVVAAGAVVTKPCTESYSIYAGIPAKKIGERNRDLDYTLTVRYRHFL